MLGSNVYLRTVIVAGSLIGIPAVAIWGSRESESPEPTPSAAPAGFTEVAEIALPEAASETHQPHWQQQPQMQFELPSDADRVAFVEGMKPPLDQAEDLPQESPAPEIALPPATRPPTRPVAANSEPLKQHANIDVRFQQPLIPESHNPAFWPVMQREGYDVLHAVPGNTPTSGSSATQAGTENRVADRQVQFLAPSTPAGPPPEFRWSSASLAEINQRFAVYGVAYVKLESWRADGVIRAVVAVPIVPGGEEHRFFESTGTSLDEVLEQLYQQVVQTSGQAANQAASQAMTPGTSPASVEPRRE